MSDERLPVAVIGVGGVGEVTLRALLQSDVVGISDRDGRVAEALAQYVLSL